MAELKLTGLKKRYGSLEVVRGIDLTIANGEFTVFVGPSGCGKSTILRMIAGLETVTEGTIQLGDRNITNVLPRDRHVAMVFQDYALYPHMTVMENMEFGLKMRRIAASDRRESVRTAARMLQIEHLLERRPSQLSGGQQQRVAMGRAIVRKADMFLYDEPLSNLDAKLRVDMRSQIMLLHQAVRTTTVFVTHDQTEAMTLGDKIVCLRDGRVVQYGTPEELYHKPANAFVASFIGSPSINLLQGKILSDNNIDCVQLADGTKFPLSRSRFNGLHNGRRILVGLRPEIIRIGKTKSSNLVSFDLMIELCQNLGSDKLIFGKLTCGESLVIREEPSINAKHNDCLEVAVDPNELHIFDAETEETLLRRTALV